ncbi:MAG: MFS transporter [Polyangiaceae bacterium]|nr:MFS transporter [Polyangiaceae bacterium]
MAQQQRRPGIFIPTLYFAEGLPYTVVNLMSAIFFKSLGSSNVLIGWLSILTWPWVLKFAWSPLVDFLSSKRQWVIVTEFLLSALVLGIAVVAYASGFLSMGTMIVMAGGILTLTALVSATHDISVDGYYLDALNDEQKALFVGVRNTAYRISIMFGSGAMVFLAGKVAEHHSLGLGWAAAFALCALALLLCAMFHHRYLPKTGVDLGVHSRPIVSRHSFFEAITTYFKQPGISVIVFYILTFRLGDALMLKQCNNFLLDPPHKAGLGVSVADVGMISGTVGIVALLFGGMFASWLISKGGLRRWMWPLALIQSVAILLYWALAKWPAAFALNTSSFDNVYVPAVYVINSAEQFAYGMGVTAYTVFLLRTVRSGYKAAHYATATALMALGVMLPGIASGYLYKILGYADFFLVSFFASLPGIVAIFFLPLWKKDDGEQSACSAGQPAAADTHQ